MKTIEERAREYIYSNFLEEVTMRNEIGNAYIAGAESERADLTRWNDPKEVLPENDKMVLVKRKSDAPLPYDLAQYDGSCWIDSWCGLMIDIIGWRQIHE